MLLPLPDTFEVRRSSARAGRGQVYLRLPDDIEESEVPRAFAGGEVRFAHSGHVVGPNSRHKSGDLDKSNGLPVAYVDGRDASVHNPS